MKIASLLSVYALLLTFTLQAQNYKWIKGGGSTTGMSPSMNFERVEYLCTDDNKNVYILAKVGNNNITADTFHMSIAHDHYGAASYDTHTFLASYDCNGNMRWAKLIESYNFAEEYGLAYSNGSIYIVGILIGPDKYIGYDTFINNAHLQSYLARFDTLGHFKWIQFVGADNTYTELHTGYSAALAIDGGGYIHHYDFIQNGVQLSGSFSTSVTGTYDLKYDSTGNLLSAVKMQIDTNMAISSVDINTTSENAYAVLSENPLSAGLYNQYIAAFDATGIQLWADTAGDATVLDQLKFDNHTSIYGTGVGQIDPFILDKDTFVNSYSGGDITVIFKMDTLGHMKWGYDLSGSTDVNGVISLALLPDNKIAAGGGLIGTTKHGIDSIFTPSAGQNPLLAIVDTSGKLIFLDQLHSGGSVDGILTMTSDKDGNVYAGGMIETSITASGLSSGYTSVGGNTDFFVAKYGYKCNCSLATEPTPNYTYTGSGSVNFTYTGATSPDSVKWNFGDGGTSTVLNPTHNFHDTGLHHVCLTVYACDSGSYCGYMHTTLSVPVFAAIPIVSVYPNPISGAFFIEGAEMRTTVRLFNVMGQLVYEGTIKDNKQQINTGDLRLGTYLLQLIDKEGRRENVTIVKQ